MKISRVLVPVVFLVCCMLPASAYAQGGWWDWLDAFSGPGPYNNGWMLGTRLACFLDNNSPGTQSTEQKFTRASLSDPDCLANASKVRAYFEVRGGRITSDETKPLFADRPQELLGSVAAHTVQGYFMYQFDPAFAVGAGAGLLWFSGKPVDGHPTRFAFTPISVAVRPVAIVSRGRWGRLVTFQFEEIALVGNLTAKDFNPASTSSFQTKADLVRSVSVLFDVLPFVR